MIRINNPYIYFKYFILILPFFVLLSCTDEEDVLEPEPPDTKTYTVTFETNGGSDIMSQKVVKGEKAVKPTNDPTKGSQIFIGWFANVAGTGDAFNFDTLVNNDLTLYAIWGYTISFKTNGGSTVDNQTIIEGGKAVKPTNDPTKGSLTFVIWSITADGTGDAFDFNTLVNNDLTLYAIWGYTISFETNGGSTVDNQTIIEGGKAVKPTNDPTKGSLTFVIWSITADGTGDAFDFNTLVNNDLTLYAIWGYTISFETNGGSTVDNQTIIEGGKAVKPTNDPTKGSLTFVGWSITADGTGDAFDFDTTLTENITLYAIWIDITKTYTITFETNGGDAVSEQKIEGGSKVVFVDANQASKAFIWWYTSPTFEISTRYDFDKVVTGDITLYAKWEEASRYTISENKITYISDASGIVEIPYSVDGSLVTAVEEGSVRSIFVLENYAENETVTQVILPNSIKIIGVSAFSDCSRLTSIIIPDSVISIGELAFNGAGTLTSITIPDSVTSIGQFAFQDCNALISITIGNGVTSIGDLAFAFCNSLTSITIPNSVTSIGNGTFQNCFSLTSITIPNSVTSIGTFAFFGCSSLRSITIPDSVIDIGTSAFRECSQLASVRVEATTPPTLGDDDVFDGTLDNLSITVPAASVATYKVATNWSTYATKIIGY